MPWNDSVLEPKNHMYRQEKLCLDIVTVPHGSLMLSDIAMEDGSCTDILLWFSKTTLNCQRIGD
jgi:hypothetical protein